MILYYAPGGCSFADHIALIETALPYRLIRVDRGKLTEDGRDFLTINPKGLLPALELDDGTVLTENLAILVYIAHRAGALLPENGLDRWRALEVALSMLARPAPFVLRALQLALRLLARSAPLVLRALEIALRLLARPAPLVLRLLHDAVDLGAPRRVGGRGGNGGLCRADRDGEGDREGGHG